MSTSLDLTWLFIVIAIAVVWSIGIGVWWERNRRGGTRDMRRQRNLARRQRDEARALADVTVTENGELAATIDRHATARPRPGAGPAGAAQAPAATRPAAAHSPLHLVGGVTP